MGIILARHQNVKQKSASTSADSPPITENSAMKPPPKEVSTSIEKLPPKENSTSIEKPPPKENSTSIERPPLIDNSASAKKRVLLSNHSQHEELAGRIADAMRDTGYDVMVINESRPQALKEREQAIRWCEVFVAVTSIRYQRDLYLLELVNYAKTIRKSIITILGHANYKPSGSMGAISAASLKIIDFANKDEFSNAFGEMSNEITAITETSIASKPHQISDTSASVKPTSNTKGSGVFISYQNDASSIAQMISGALKPDSSVVLGDPLKSCEKQISDCQVFVAVLSSQYEASETSQNSYELARMHHKHIIPVIGVKNYQAKEWLALAIAGKLYYEMPDRETAYKPFYDSSTMTLFCYSVKAFLQPHASEEEREKCEILALDKELEECRGKLSSWPPEQRPKDEVQQQEKEIKVGDDESKLVFNYIHHEVTRMEFVPPKPLFDGRGVPLRPTFDVMCSYQWSIQDFVRDLYMDLHMRNMDAWIDIWGGMLGNINEAMANAIECSAVIVCFLTEKYQQSVNCCLELKYAIQRERPIIFIKVEPNLTVLPWIAEHVVCSNVFEMRSISDAGIMDNGIPRINRIAELIRVYSTSAQRKPVEDDVTEEVYARREMVENALYWIHKNAGTARFTKCGRCGVDFDENSMEGCKQHTAYYMGGTILAGRWVCCQQREKDGPGCEKTKHTSTVYTWKEIPGHGGCFKWST